MTEKRFTFNGVTATEIEIYDNGRIIGKTCHNKTCNSFVITVVNLLNDLNNENEQLKERLKKNCPGIVWRDLE